MNGNENQVISEVSERYTFLIKQAWKKYRQGNPSEMSSLLQQSVKLTSYYKAEIISDWVERFANLAKEDGESFDVEFLSSLPEWNQIFNQILVENRARWIELSKTPYFVELQAPKARLVELSGQCIHDAEADSKAALASVEYIDSQNNKIQTLYKGLNFSEQIGSYYSYIPAAKSGTNSTFHILLLLPENTSKIKLGCRQWRSQYNLRLAYSFQLNPLTTPLQAQFSDVIKTAEKLYQFLSVNAGEIQQQILFEGVSFLEDVYQKSEKCDLLIKGAKLLYFKIGNIFRAASLLEKLDKKSYIEEKDRQTEVQIQEARHLLVQQVSIPVRQPNPLHRVKSDKVMYCLDSSPVFTINGYTSRSHGICCSLQKAGYQVEAVTRPGYPWEKPSLGSSLPKCDRLERKQGEIVYTALNGPKINHPG